MESFVVAVNAVVPFLFYISLGYLVRHMGMADEGFLRKLNQIVFKAFFPFVMFYNMYQIDPDFVLNVRVFTLGAGCLLGLIMLMLLIIPRLVPGNPRRGVVIQAIYRSNFVLFAIPLTESVFGAENTTLASMMVAIIIPIYNVAAVMILEYFRGGKLRPAVLVKNICTNPLILGAMTGLVFYLLHIHLPQCIVKPVSQISSLTTPMALFVLGGTLQFSSIQSNIKYLASALSFKMIVVPAMVLAIASAAGLEPLEKFVLFTMFATPVAASSYPMAQNMGGDGDLAGEFVVVSTVASVFTLFAWIFLLKTIGMI